MDDRCDDRRLLLPLLDRSGMMDDETDCRLAVDNIELAN